MSAVKRPFRAVNRQVDIGITAHTKDRLFATRLMHRAVTNDPGIRSQDVFVERDNFSQMWRAGFLLAFEEELDICSRLNTAFFERRIGGEDCHHARFVVGSRPGIEPPLRVNHRACRR